MAVKPYQPSATTKRFPLSSPIFFETAYAGPNMRLARWKWSSLARLRVTKGGAPTDGSVARPDPGCASEPFGAGAVDGRLDEPEDGPLEGRRPEHLRPFAITVGG